MRLAKKLRLMVQDPGRFAEFALRNRLFAQIEDWWLDYRRPLGEGVVNTFELRVLGMRRAGNHAVVNWLMRSRAANRPTGRQLHLNNVSPGANAFRTRAQYWAPAPPPAEPAAYFTEVRRRRRRDFDPLDLLVLSYEDFSIDAFLKPVNPAYHGRSAAIRPIVILRDPYNLLASRMKSDKRQTRDGRSEIALFNDNFRVLDEPRGGVIPVIYNHWLTSVDYRQELLHRIFDGEAIDRMDTKPSFQGGGSSFTGRSQVLASQDLISRWRRLENDPSFMSEVLADQGLREVMERAFPEALVAPSNHGAPASDGNGRS
ncbi:MAG: hypothetical protein AAFR79_18290 [Pseudomonadota bacterium]